MNKYRWWFALFIWICNARYKAFRHSSTSVVVIRLQNYITNLPGYLGSIFVISVWDKAFCWSAGVNHPDILNGAPVSTSGGLILHSEHDLSCRFETRIGKRNKPNQKARICVSSATALLPNQRKEILTQRINFLCCGAQEWRRQNGGGVGERGDVIRPWVIKQLFCPCVNRTTSRKGDESLESNL